MSYIQSNNFILDLDVFLSEVDKAILSGNIKYIRNAITKYENILDKSYIVWASSIALQIVEEQLDEIII
jgi:hypothetical protein